MSEVDGGEMLGNVGLGGGMVTGEMVVDTGAAGVVKNGGSVHSSQSV